MKSINPIFIQGKSQKKKFERATRSDKTKDIKFPVTEEVWLKLRQGAIVRGLGPKQTKHNTSLLNAVLLLNLDQIAPVEYRDTGKYMHVKPAQLPLLKIQEYMLLWGFSERKTVHRLMINAISGGGNK